MNVLSLTLALLLQAPTVDPAPVAPVARPPARVVDVRNFGARFDADPATNAKAFQAAHDSFADKVANDTVGAAGTVIVPACTWTIDRTIWCDLPNVSWVGAGKGSIVKMDPRARPNVFQFGIRRAGLTPDHYVPAAGKLDATAGTRWGLRTLGDSWLQFQAGPLDQGPQSPTAGGYTCDLWGEQTAICLELCIDPPPAGLAGQAPVCGIKGSRATSWDPRPFHLCGDGAGTGLYFSFRTADQDEWSAASRGFRIPIDPAAPRPWRICVQLDTVAGTAQAYFAGSQVALAAPLNMGDLAGQPFLANHYLPFMAGATGPAGPVGQPTTGSDLTFYGLRVGRKARYRADGPGTPQARLEDGKAPTDAQAYFSNDADTVAYLPLVAGPEYGRVVPCRAGNAGFGVPTSGIFMSCQNPGGLVGNGIRNMQVVAGNGYGQAISLGAVLDPRLDGVTAWNGCHGIGAWNTMASYYVRLRDCTLHGYGSPYYGYMQLLWARDTTFLNSGRATIRLAGCNGDWDGAAVAFPSPGCEAFARLHTLDYGGFHSFRNVLVDFEGDVYKRAGVVCEAHAYTPATVLRMTDVMFGSLGKDIPAVELVDCGTPPVYQPAVFAGDGISAWPPRGQAVKLHGPLWRGTLANSPALTGVGTTGRWGPDMNVKEVRP